MVRYRVLYIGVIILTLAKRGLGTSLDSFFSPNEYSNQGGYVETSSGPPLPLIIIIIVCGSVGGILALTLICYCCIKGCEGFFNCCERCIICCMNISDRKTKKRNNNSTDQALMVEDMENGWTEIDWELVEGEADAGWTWETMNSLLNSQGQSLLRKLAPLMDVPIFAECVRATIIQDWQKDQLMARQVKYERSDEFLGMLKAGPVNKFLRFRYILRKNDQTEVANMLSLPVISPPIRSGSSSSSCSSPPHRL